MNIIDKNLSFGSLSPLGTVKRIIIHHAEASNCTVEDVHRWHKNNGWAGMGYHFFVRKDGSIYRGRPETKLGSHTANTNTGSLGICFEGRYQTEDMPQTQINAGIELVNYLIHKYGLLKSCVYKHKDFNSTDCPGAKFPFEKIKNGTTITPAEQKPSNPSNEKWTYKYDAWIGELQDYLIARGHNVSRDCIAGDLTYCAISAYTLSNGERATLAKLVQKRLGVAADGIVGPITYKAINDFQRANGLGVGYLGGSDWYYLIR